MHTFLKKNSLYYTFNYYDFYTKKIYFYFFPLYHFYVFKNFPDVSHALFVILILILFLYNPIIFYEINFTFT